MMVKLLLLVILLLNTKTTENISVHINKKFPVENEPLKKLNINFNKGPVEINYVIDGCSSLMILRLLVEKKEDKYAIKLYMPPEPQGVLHDYNELKKKVKYYKTYMISSEKIKELNSILLPNSDIRSTTYYYWTVKSSDEELSFHDRAGGHGIGKFILSLNNK